MIHRKCPLLQVLFLLPLIAGLTPGLDASPIADSSAVVVDDFEAYPTGEFPRRWVFVDEDRTIKSFEEAREPGEEFYIAEEDGNQFLRVNTRNEAQRYTLRNGEEFNWRLKRHPWLQWEWRARKLPEGASERGKNDTGAAMYVTFGSDWLGRPKSIKYTYSSSLPVGTVVSFGPLKVLVVDSAQEPRLGQWKTVRRNIIADYEQIFGGRPPNRPVSITVWSDSDTTGDVARVDFDDIKLLPPLRR
jgi:hypothetical protein